MFTRVNSLSILLLLGLSSSICINAQEPQTTKPPVYGAYPPNSEICFDNLGCFSNSAPFNNTGNYLPVSPKLINPEFLLFTRETIEDPFIINYERNEAVRDSKFDPKKELKVIIHGFQNSRQSVWINTMKNTLLKYNDVNVIIVDWGNGAVYPHYNNASSNSRLVGRTVCNLIKTIKKTFYESDQSKLRIHCIGHSLGAHTCGYSSAECGSTFDRITAMDPAGPMFEDSDPMVRVDPTDAKFVDVIHTNMGSLLTASFGLVMPTGHVDFYVNGGKWQNGCPGVTSMIAGIFGAGGLDVTKEISCSHNRAFHFFTESINPSTNFNAYPCPSAEAFTRGECFKCGEAGCTQMGLRSIKYKSRGSYYLTTSDKSPYSGSHHFVELFLSSSMTKTGGDLTAFFHYKGQNFSKPISVKEDDLKPGETVKKVFVTDVDLQEVDEVELYFERRPKPLFGSELPPKFTFDKIRVRNVEIDETYSFCAAGTSVEDKKYTSFKLKDNDC